MPLVVVAIGVLVIVVLAVSRKFVQKLAVRGGGFDGKVVHT